MKPPEDKIPMQDLRAQHAEIEEELLEAFSAVLASGQFVLGETVEAFESDLAKLCDVRYAIGCNSGTDALSLSLMALGIGPGDAVLCPAYSFFASAATIARVGATPVFCDIDPATFNLDPEDAIRVAEQTPNLRALLSVDLFGRLCDLGPAEAYFEERGLPLIEDAAQSIGALDAAGRHPGQRGRIACFSFYPTKNLGALGDAGSVLTNDAELAARVSRLRVHGESETGRFDEIGINSRLDALQAVALAVKLRHLDAWTRARRRLAHRYDALFAELGARPGTEAQPVGSLPPSTDPKRDDYSDLTLPLRTPAPEEGRERHTYHRYVVRVPAERRAALIDALRREGIASEIYYARGLHDQPALASFRSEHPLPETERATQESLALPLFPELGIERVERVVGVVARHLTESRPRV